MNLSEFLILLFTLKVGVVNWIALKTMLWEFPGGLVVRTQCFHCWGPGLMVAQSVKNLPAVWEMWVWPLGWEDPLEKKMATHFSGFLPGEFHGQRSLEGYSPWGLKRVRHDLVVKQQQQTCPLTLQSVRIQWWKPGKFLLSESYILKDWSLSTYIIQV